MTKIRHRAGARWRVLAHPKDGPPFEARDQGIFDELVVDHWLHIEQTSARSWWMQLGPLRINVTLRADGKVDLLLERDGGPGGKAQCSPSIDTAGEDHPGEDGATWWGRVG